ncbi:GL24712 [Drosophila persimilis]|uniref:GL24712 n=1 Tax=Drosophila persimilis TaxID=7234 RepID=B4HCA5_DROPE|nr:GL24712 [Drosophila persimilis]
MSCRKAEPKCCSLILLRAGVPLPISQCPVMERMTTLHLFLPSLQRSEVRFLSMVGHKMERLEYATATHASSDQLLGSPEL